MNERIMELAEESGMTQYVAAHNKFLERFAKMIVADCSEIVRGVLRDEGSTLSYNDAGTLQERFKEAFGISPDWSEP